MYIYIYIYIQYYPLRITNIAIYVNVCRQMAFPILIQKKNVITDSHPKKHCHDRFPSQSADNASICTHKQHTYTYKYMYTYIYIYTYTRMHVYVYIHNIMQYS